MNADDTSAKVEEIRERWASNEVPWPDGPNTEPSAPEDIAFLLGELERVREMGGEAIALLTREVSRLEEQRDRLRVEVERLRHERDGEVWLWLGDGTDDVESLACPVLMSAEQVRALTGEVERLTSLGEEGLADFVLEGIRAVAREAGISDVDSESGGFLGASTVMRMLAERLEGVREQERRRALEVEQLQVEVERLKASAIVRRPIETLPEERKEVVLLYEVDGGEIEASGILHPDHRAKWVAGGAWTEWSPLPLPAESAALPSREETATELRAAGLEPGKVGRELRERLAASAARLELQSLMVEDWDAGWTPERAECMVASVEPDVPGGWWLRWRDVDGDDLCAEIPWPFRPGVTVTADMLRALGFTVEEG